MEDSKYVHVTVAPSHLVAWPNQEGGTNVASSPGLPRLFVAASDLKVTKSLGRPGDEATTTCNLSRNTHPF